MCGWVKGLSGWVGEWEWVGRSPQSRAGRTAWAEQGGTALKGASGAALWAARQATGADPCSVQLSKRCCSSRAHLVVLGVVDGHGCGVHKRLQGGQTAGGAGR